MPGLPIVSDLKLFRTVGAHVEEFSGQSLIVEKSLQHLIETNLEVGARS